MRTLGVLTICFACYSGSIQKVYGSQEFSQWNQNLVNGIWAQAGGEGVGGGNVNQIAPDKNGFPRVFLVEEYESSYHLAAGRLAEFVRNLDKALQINEAHTRRSLGLVLQDVRLGGNDLEVSTDEMVETFLAVYRQMKESAFQSTGSSLEDFILNLEFTFVDDCVDSDGRSSDFCTEFFELLTPIKISKAFRKSDPKYNVVLGMIYHEVTRKLLGRVDDNHLHGSVVVYATPHFNGGFFNQGLCWVEKETCYDRNRSIEAFGVLPIVIPYVDTSCLIKRRKSFAWYFDWDDLFRFFRLT